MAGLGGILTIPISFPATLVASWIVHARLAAAIACICGHDPGEDRVQTFILLSLLGTSALDAVKHAGVQVGRKASTQLVRQIPGRLLIEINKRVGFRLLTKTGQKGVVNFIKVVPLVGGAVGGAIDAATCRATGRLARSLFCGKELASSRTIRAAARRMNMETSTRPATPGGAGSAGTS